MTDLPLTLGAIPLNSNRCSFRIWAPAAEKVELHLSGPPDRLVTMQPGERGYYSAIVEGVPPGSDYGYRLDCRTDRPDPASRWQPYGVHGPSRVFDSRFEWNDAAWPGVALRDYVLYEIHVGTFTPEGTFDAVIPHLPKLKELGITAIELMPVAQFPGSRNWGYDGVSPFAVQDSYGGPAGLQRLVDAAHQHGFAVVLDVVYNHLGPEGNYLGEFGPYFTDRYKTPWGAALNFDGPHSDEVRRYFIENALYWQAEFHLDALRLDAVHAIRDFSAIPFLEELAATCHRAAERIKRPFHLIAESDLNMARHILPRDLGGYGLDAQWSDDFHHCLHVLLTDERDGYYADYEDISRFAKVWREGYSYTGEFSAYRGHRHGSSPQRNPVKQFVVCSQNHDQIGNRMLGNRLSTIISFEQQKLAAGAVLLSPFIPLLFMGEEYGETAPFQYFASHTDPALVEAVREGRRAEFAAFAWRGETPDPEHPETFRRCQLNHSLANQGQHKLLREFYRELLKLRRDLPALAKVEKETLETTALASENVLLVRQWHGADELMILFNFAREARTLKLRFPDGHWQPCLNSAGTRWGGPVSTTAAIEASSQPSQVELSPTSFILFRNLKRQ